MPYYEEYFETDSSSMETTTGSTTSTYPLALESAHMIGFRSRPNDRAHLSRELLDIQVDPYAYFLDEASESRYKARLAERNLPAQGSPDRGHAWALSKYSLRGTWMSTTRVRKVAGQAETRNSCVNPVFAPDTSVLGLESGTTPLRARSRGSNATLETFAQRAYASSAPTARVFDAAQFLGELREGLPRLALQSFKAGARVFKGLGSDYLNVEFGWKPFINDIVNAGRALAGATSVLSGANQRVHRRYGTPTSYTSSDIRFTSASLSNWIGMPGLRGMYSGNDLPILPYGNSFGPSGAAGSWLRTSETTRWFEGEFTNFLPLGFNPNDYFQKLSLLVNLELTPQVLWELAPWSWLVDWSLHIDKTIAANQIAANDLLVMHYGYAMEKVVFRDFLTLDMSAIPRSKPAGNPGAYEYWINLPAHASWVSTTEFKTRVRANPYGFRTGGTSSLSGGQLAILGALGLTRSR